jgi:hypothetical protein
MKDLSKVKWSNQTLCYKQNWIIWGYHVNSTIQCEISSDNTDILNTIIIDMLKWSLGGPKSILRLISQIFGYLEVFPLSHGVNWDNKVCLYLLWAICPPHWCSPWLNSCNWIDMHINWNLSLFSLDELMSSLIEWMRAIIELERYL